MGSDESHFNACTFPLPRVDPLNDTRAHAPACQQTQSALRPCHGRFYCQSKDIGRSVERCGLSKTQTARELKMLWFRMLLLNYMYQFWRRKKNCWHFNFTCIAYIRTDGPLFKRVEFPLHCYEPVMPTVRGLFSSFQSPCHYMSDMMIKESSLSFKQHTLPHLKCTATNM